MNIKKIIMLGFGAAAMLQTIAAPSVEITEAWQAKPGSGVVDFTYKVSDVGGEIGNVLIKVGAKGVPQKVVTNENVTAGLMATTNINYKQLLGKAYPNVSLSAFWEPRGVQLWKDGPYWAECNVGATKPEEPGYYFSWGDTVAYKLNADSCLVHVDDPTWKYSYWGDMIGNFPQLLADGFIDSTWHLVAAHDAATEHLGAPWRMPMAEEVVALINNCTTTWTVRNGMYGRLVTGKGEYASNSIFLPAAGGGWYDFQFEGLGTYGAYLTSTLRPDSCVLIAYISADYDVDTYYNEYKQVARSVRPVRHPVTTCNVTLDANGGWCSSGSKVYSYGAAIGALPAPTRDGYWFSGWFTAAEGGIEVNSTTLVLGSMTLYAHWVSGGVQLWKDGPYFAECNVGATKPEEAGCYFCWGDTMGWVPTTGYCVSAMDGVSSYGCTYYPYAYRYQLSSGNNQELKDAGFSDNVLTGILNASHDAATAHWGAPWRMMTKDELDKLVDDAICKRMWTSNWAGTGKTGYVVTGVTDGYTDKSIFFPAVGYGSTPLSSHEGVGSGGSYWSSEPRVDDSNSAWSLSFSSESFYADSIHRCKVCPIRAVR